MQVKPSGRRWMLTWMLTWNTMTMHALPEKGLSGQDKQIQFLISVGITMENSWCQGGQSKSSRRKIRDILCQDQMSKGGENIIH